MVGHRYEGLWDKEPHEERRRDEGLRDEQLRDVGLRGEGLPDQRLRDEELRDGERSEGQLANVNLESDSITDRVQADMDPKMGYLDESNGRAPRNWAPGRVTRTWTPKWGEDEGL